MANEIQPQTDHGDARVGIAVSRYNESITSKLLTGAVDTLIEHGVSDERIDVAWAPGAWELPLVASELLESQPYDAVLCLGCVIRGETTHDQHINRQVSMTLGELSLQFRTPVAFGLLTCNSLDQAINRAGGAVGNKGQESAEAALEMMGLLKSLRNRAAESAG